MTLALNSSDKEHPVTAVFGRTSVNLIEELITRKDPYILEIRKIPEGRYVLNLFNGQDVQPMLSQEILPTPRGRHPLGHIKNVLDDVDALTKS